MLKINSDLAEFTFDEEVNTTSPGQACVFYLDRSSFGWWLDN